MVTFTPFFPFLRAPWRPFSVASIQLHAVANAGSVSVGHGPGAPANEGTAPDRSTPVPDSNLTGIDATQEPDSHAGQARPPASKGGGKVDLKEPLVPGSKGGPAQAR